MTSQTEWMTQFQVGQRLNQNRSDWNALRSMTAHLMSIAREDANHCWVHGPLFHVVDKGRPKGLRWIVHFFVRGPFVGTFVVLAFAQTGAVLWEKGQSSVRVELSVSQMLSHFLYFPRLPSSSSSVSPARQLLFPKAQIGSAEVNLGAFFPVRAGEL